jgi:hypothetical protein
MFGFWTTPEGGCATTTTATTVPKGAVPPPPPVPKGAVPPPPPLPPSPGTSKKHLVGPFRRPLNCGGASWGLKHSHQTPCASLSEVRWLEKRSIGLWEAALPSASSSASNSLKATDITTVRVHIRGPFLFNPPPTGIWANPSQKKQYGKEMGFLAI